MDEGNWFVVEDKIDDLPAFVRFRDTVESYISSGNYRRYLRVVWECEDADELGIPSESEWQQLEDFENSLCDVLGADYHAVLTFVMTNDGLRQWLFYTQDVQESSHRINQMPQKEERLPIELTTEEDPKWEEYKKIAETFDVTEAEEILDDEEA